MNPFESRDPAALARADERSLELLRLELVLSCNDDRESVIDELVRRGTAAISTETSRLGRARGLARQQVISAAEQAAVTLAMRLRIPHPLKTVTLLARELAGEAIQERAPESQPPPRMVSRPPELYEASDGIAASASAAPESLPMRRIRRALRDAAQEGRIKRNNPGTS
jgi:hypothetical protein